jgi:1-acyl-sn-glycerol-3-phosphate acyltransferase
MVDYATSLFNEHDKFVLLVPAEGRRKKVDRWKTGFYHIARNAKVPVSLGYLDYKKKIAGVGMLINLTGVFEKDMQIIEDFISNYHENTQKCIIKRFFNHRAITKKGLIL